MVPYLTDNVDLRPVLIGRESEAALLRMGVTKALVGRGSVNTVAGAAGVGKSRLLAEIEDTASDHGMLMLSGIADPGSSRVPYGLFVDVLAQCLPHLAPRRRDVWKKTVVHLAPHLGEALFPGAEDHTGDGAELDPGVRHTLFLAALVEMLLRRAEQHPLFISFEDLHWTDSASLRALRYLASRLGKSRLMIVATYRPGEGELPDELTKTLEHFQTLSHHSRVQLDTMPQAETRALVGSCFPTSDFSNDLLDQVYHDSQGSPSFVMQYLELMRDKGVIHEQDDSWIDDSARDPQGPDSPPTLAKERLRLLSVQEREVFTFAAPQGVNFDPQLIARALEQPYVRVLHTLAGLERTQHVTRSVRGQYRFSSIVTAYAFLADLPAVRRRRAHLRLAVCLEQMHATQVEQLAHHFYHAWAGERALPYLIDAGRRAQESEGFWEANGFFLQALEILAATGTDRCLRMEVSLALAEVAEMLGDLTRADALCRDVLDATTPESDLSMIGQAMSLRGWLRYRAGSWETALASYDRALDIFTDLGDQVLLAQTHLRLGNIAFERSRMEAAANHFGQAKELALEAGDVRMLGGIYGNLGVLCSVRGKHEQAVAAYGEALKAHRRSNNDYGVAQTMHNLGMTYAGRKDWEEALSCYTEGERLGRDMGTIDVLANILVSRAAAQIGIGDHDGAETSNQGARIYYEEMNDPLGLAECEKIAGIIGCQRGQHVAAAVALLKSRRISLDLENRLGVAECELELARARQARGDLREARQFYEAAVVHFEEAGAYTETDQARALLAELDS